ncbi:hypothetical protein Ga0123462_1046 [Mariprofundus ferrinatatus]|uniref:Uncharacterized protein n=1 Tax=Mariprofundus ferrinatatus TaxID=1921087 RepID=A0A2K8L3T6_9PROT|nr:DUF4234 domain-containing protein [Mariprofundus ferrinatatus]ATX81913.1 hypothetical protein Ga0123462_1046 [Mariprofundus ferrinatatus]
MYNHDTSHLAELRYIESWKMVALALVTFGLYLAYFIRRQSAIINRAAGTADARLPAWAAALPQLLAPASLLTFIAQLLVPGELIEHVDQAAGLLFNISLVIWGFAARSAMHSITAAGERSKLRFDGIWTLLISPFYFNYRVNGIFEEERIAA